MPVCAHRHGRCLARNRMRSEYKVQMKAADSLRSFSVLFYGPKGTAYEGGVWKVRLLFACCSRRYFTGSIRICMHSHAYIHMQMCGVYMHTRTNTHTHTHTRVYACMRVYVYR